MSRPGKTEYAVNVGPLFWRAAGRRRIASGACRAGLAADFKASPVCSIAGAAGKTAARNRQRDALQHEGEDQDRGGKLPARRPP
jgi:hypothetical protein